MLNERFKMAANISIDTAERMYKHGISTIITDGEYVQLDSKELVERDK